MTIAMTMDNFQKIIMEDSKTKLVLVTFWADQIVESLELRDQLAKKLQGFEEHILLASVDCQAEQQIPMQFGVQGLPTAVLVKDGQPLDGLSGPQTNEDIDEFLAKHLPKPEENLLVQARQLVAEKDYNQAFSIISQAYELNSERADIKLVLADVYISIGKTQEAEQLLTTVKMVDQDGDYATIMAKLELANQAADSPEIQALEAQLANDSENVVLQQNLAAQYHQVNRNEEALNLLFRLVQKDGGDHKSKDLLLDILKTLPDGDSLATKFRRKLYTLMY